MVQVGHCIGVCVSFVIVFWMGSPTAHRGGRGLDGVVAYCAVEDMDKLLPLASRHVDIVCDQVVGV